ncbi:MAG: hypothetical protein AVDCRST_MAG40-2916, partial [uncultured Gemmatimonadaceae bacterium]
GRSHPGRATRARPPARHVSVGVLGWRRRLQGRGGSARRRPGQREARLLRRGRARRWARSADRRPALGAERGGADPPGPSARPAALGRTRPPRASARARHDGAERRAAAAGGGRDRAALARHVRGVPTRRGHARQRGPGRRAREPRRRRRRAVSASHRAPPTHAHQPRDRQGGGVRCCDLAPV